MPVRQQSLPLKIAVIFFMVMAFSFALPNGDHPLLRWNRTYLGPITDQFLNYTFLGGKWDMYAEYSPNWRETTLQVYSQNPAGKLLRLDYPTLNELGYWEAFRMHRRRKFVEVSNIPGFFAEKVPNLICHYYSERRPPEDKVIVMKQTRTILDPHTRADQRETSTIATCQGHRKGKF